jgi:hypothetical protein
MILLYFTFLYHQFVKILICSRWFVVILFTWRGDALSRRNAICRNVLVGGCILEFKELAQPNLNPLGGISQPGGVKPTRNWPHTQTSSSPAEIISLWVLTEWRSEGKKLETQADQRGVILSALPHTFTLTNSRLVAGETWQLWAYTKSNNVHTLHSNSSQLMLKIITPFHLPGIYHR